MNNQVFSDFLYSPPHKRSSNERSPEIMVLETKRRLLLTFDSPDDHDLVALLKVHGRGGGPGGDAQVPRHRHLLQLHALPGQSLQQIFLDEVTNIFLSTSVLCTILNSKSRTQVSPLNKCSIHVYY